MADFEEQSYWHERFSSETAFEWLLSSSDFLSLIDPLDLHTHLRRRGFLNVTNVDYEPLATLRGRELEQRAFGDVRLRYAVADATQLPKDLMAAVSSDDGPDSEKGVSRYDFRLVLDKSTCDAIACGGDDALRKMCDSVYQCLRPDGVWIALSFSADRFQLSNLPFDVEVLSKVDVTDLHKRQ